MAQINDRDRQDLIAFFRSRDGDDAAAVSDQAQALPVPTPTTNCPCCKGAGWCVLDAPVGTPQFGTLVPCHCKTAEHEQQVVADLRRKSNLAVLADKTFASFDPDVPGVRRAFVRSQAYARHPQGWLVLLGGYGCGKTHLAAAIAHTVLARREAVLFVVVPDLLDHLRSSFTPERPVRYDERFEQICTIPLLILDDLGTEHTTPWACEKLYQLMNHRYRAELPTVITSNRGRQAIEPRVLSRIYERAYGNELLVINTGDYRLRELRSPWPEETDALP